MTSWLSVDPMMDKYPALSPYNYCAWNPVKVVDPDGKDTLICYNSNTADQKTMNYARRHYSYNRPDILHYFSHGNKNYILPYGLKEYPTETSNNMNNHVRNGGEKYEIAVLHSCNVGNGDGCFAELLSIEQPDVLIFAPSDLLAVNVHKDDEYVMNNGRWNVYYGGKLVKSLPGFSAFTKLLQFAWELLPAQFIKILMLK